MRYLISAWRTEWVKAMSLKAWLWWGGGVFLVAALGSALMGLLILSLNSEDVYVILSEQDRVRSVYSSPLTLCYLMAMALGIKIYERERKQSFLPMAMLITPRRGYVALAKLTLGLVLGTWCGIMYVVGVLAGGGTVLITHGHAIIPTVGVLRTLLVIVTLCALWSAFGTGLGMLFSAVPALLSGFALALVLQVIISPIISGLPWGHKVIALLPGVATNMATEPSTGEFVTMWLPWWGSYIVLVIWVLTAALIGTCAVLRAEISVS